MKQQRRPGQPGRDPRSSPDVAAADMQPADAGTAASGNPGQGLPQARGTGRRNPADSAMRQTSKTGKER